MNIKAAIFDMDGTLVDSLFIWEVLWEKLGKTYLGVDGYIPDQKVDKTIRTLTLAGAMDYIHKTCKMGESGEELFTFVNALIKDFYKNDVELKTGVVEFLELLKGKGVKMCIASASDTEAIELALEHCGIDQYFSKIFSCAENGRGKEYPDIYIEALRFLDTERAETWVFEDSLTAIETVTAIGMPTVGIYDRNNFGHDKMQEIVNEYIAEGETLMKLSDGLC